MNLTTHLIIIQMYKLLWTTDAKISDNELHSFICVYSPKMHFKTEIKDNVSL